MELRKGMAVVAVGVGMGRVEAIEMLDVGSGPCPMARIRSFEGNLSMWVPVEGLEPAKVREPVSRAQVDEILSVIVNQEAPAERVTWNRRERRYREMLLTNDAHTLGALLGELIAVRDTKKLSFGERRMYLRVHELLLAELAAVAEVTEEVIEGRLTAALEAA